MPRIPPMPSSAPPLAPIGELICGGSPDETGSNVLVDESGGESGKWADPKAAAAPPLSPSRSSADDDDEAEEEEEEEEEEEDDDDDDDDEEEE